jgi:hypothetical protein
MSAATPATPEGSPDNPDFDILPAVTWKPWTVKLIETGDVEEFHGVPDEDKEPHIATQNCACRPRNLGRRISFSGEYYEYYRHNSYDLREIDEWFYYNIQYPELGQTDKDMQ